MTVLLERDSAVSIRPRSMVERMTLIMDALEGSQAWVLLEEIASRTGLPLSTAHRILDQLVRLQWVEHGRSGYRLGSRVQEWGAREHGHSDLRAAAAPWLQDLAVRTGLVVHLAVRTGAEVEYLDKIGGRRAMTIASRVGGRAPLHRTALGKSILAWMPAEEVDALYAGGIAASSGPGVGSVGELHRELTRIRQGGGVAHESDECVPGVACIGVAIRGPERPVGAISLVGSSDAPLLRLAPLVRDAGQRITVSMFGPQR